MREQQSVLTKERNYLLSQWAYAKDSERTELLMRIMEIDEQLEAEKNQQESQKRLA